MPFIHSDSVGVAYFSGLKRTAFRWGRPAENAQFGVPNFDGICMRKKAKESGADGRPHLINTAG